MKLVNDLIKSPNGKYSRKSVIIIIMFLFTLGIGLYIVIDDSVNTEAKGVFDSSLIFLAASLSIATVDKKILSVNTPKEEDI